MTARKAELSDILGAVGVMKDTNHFERCWRCGEVLLYGKDLRTGNNAFYTDVVW